MNIQEVQLQNLYLDDFDNQLKNFVKVFPKDYKKVISQRKSASRRESKLQ